MSPRRFLRILLAILLLGGLAVVYTLARRKAAHPVLYNLNGLPLGDLAIQPVSVKSPWGDAADAEMGRLVVPETRADTGGNRIGIAFLRLKTTAADPLPPVFFLAGGPGASGIGVAESSYYYLFREIRRHADVVLVDQRGTGRSVPSLQCPGQLGLPTDLTENIQRGVLAAIREAFRDCLDELRENGVHPASYQSDENADDIDDLRRALGYGKVTPYGYSYGTELAMVYMRRHPEAVAGAIMAGPVAPDMSLKLPAEVDGAFERLGERVRADSRLSRLVPDFAGLMRSVHAELRERPRAIEVPLMDAVGGDEGAIVTTIYKTIALFKPNWSMTMGDIHLQLMVQDLIGRDDWLGRLPAFYYRIERGDNRQVGNMLRNFRRRGLPNALLVTTHCATGYSDARMAEAKRDEEGTALSHTGISFGRGKEFCEGVDLPSLGPAELEPVTSEAPVLLIHGTLDGRTPPENVAELERRFPAHQTITVENAGHNDLLDNAIRDGILAFLQGLPVPVTRERREVTFEPPVPWAHSLEDVMDEALRRGGPDEARRVYLDLKSRYAGSSEYDYDFSEATLNNLGYRLMARNRLDDAIAVLGLNVEQFPASYNPYDSLGEALVAKGRREEGIGMYRKSLDLNFLNGNAYAKLRELGAEPAPGTSD